MIGCPKTAETDSPPIVWTAAGSDSGGGAGIQADLKVFNAFGVHGCSAITALTAQNTTGVKSVEPVSPEMLKAQLEALAGDLPAAAVKTGMLGNKTNCEIIAAFFGSLPAPLPPLICDPVLKSTSGANLLEPDAVDLLKRALFPKVAVLTPNLPETEFLLNRPVDSVESAAKALLGFGCGSVLIKGGHSEGNECRDYWTDGSDAFWLLSPRIETTASHGTGCILSAAIAASMAKGRSIPEAVTEAKTFLNQCLKSPLHIGSGHGPMQIRPFENRMEDRPLK